MIQPFHIAIPVKSIENSIPFYKNVLNCKQGKRLDNLVVFNFFGHLLVLHEKKEYQQPKQLTNLVNGNHVPVPHFGMVLAWNDWHNLIDKLKALNTTFVIAPHTIHKGKINEQATVFFNDFEGNTLEFKTFKNSNQLFL